MKAAGISEAIARNRFTVLTVTLVLLFVLYPFVEADAWIENILLDIIFLAISLATLWAVSEKRPVLYTAIILAALGFVSRWFTFGLPADAVTAFGNACDVLFFLVTVTAILIYALRADQITADKLFAAISAYLFFGLIWALLYTLLENLVPGSFANIDPAHEIFSQLTYYSFVTMTTLGYGDITPASEPAQTFACLEAAIGQLYPAILIARLVGLHTAQSLRVRSLSTEGRDNMPGAQ